MLEEEYRESLYRDYMTTAIKVLAESYVVSHGGEIHMPSYIEMTHEAEKPKTARQILEHVKKLFD